MSRVSIYMFFFVDVNVHSILGLKNDWYLLVMSDFCYVTKINFTHMHTYEGLNNYIFIS